jgi:hypothetical protein
MSVKRSLSSRTRRIAGCGESGVCSSTYGGVYAPVTKAYTPPFIPQHAWAIWGSTSVTVIQCRHLNTIEDSVLEVPKMVGIGTNLNLAGSGA